MEKLYQCHLLPKLEVPRLPCLGRNQTRASTVGGKHSSKELFKQCINSYSEHIHMSLQHGSPPPVHVVTWTFMYTHELQWDVGQIALASRSTLNINIRHLQARVQYSLSSKTDYVRVTTMERLDKDHLYAKLEVRDWHVSAGNSVRRALW